jgi:hypothetical protein
MNGLFFYLVNKNLDLSISMLLMTLMNIIFALPFIYIIKFKSEKLFNKMKA